MKNRLEKNRAVPKWEVGDARFSNHYLDLASRFEIEAS
jgi:hypothetical protein